MAAWTSGELRAVGEAEELEIAPAGGESTLRDPVTIWVVRHGDDIYVRSVNGPGSAWYRGSQVRHQGRIEAGGVEKDVDFADGKDANDEIDAAYRSKYSRYSENTISRITSDEARSTTIRLVPRSSRAPS